MQYRLRPADETDFEALFALNREAMGEYVEATWGAWDDALQQSFFRERLDAGRTQVIEVDGEVAGLLELASAAGGIEVSNIALSETFRRRGLGSHVLRDIIAAAGSRPVTLQVLKTNPARELYERLGFVSVGETETHIQMRRDGDASGA